MNLETIKSQFKKLKMYASQKELDEILSKNKKAVDLGWLSEVLEVELDFRNEVAIQRRIHNAQFPELRSLEQFNWEFNPKIPRENITELSTLKFVEKNEIALFLGNPGTGKTHCAIAIGMQAARYGHKVYCTSVKRLTKKILIAKKENTLDVLFKKILTSKLWILDDWGVVSMNRDVSEEIFDLFDRRKHNSAMLLTSNRDVEEWPQVFSDPVLANAAIDRMFETANICVFEGESYRMKGRILLKDFDKEN
jgi:DNA replication protein DnaC